MNQLAAVHDIRDEVVYSYEKMKIYSIKEALFLRDILKSMPGYYWCYPDNTEESIISYPTKKEIVSKYRNGVFLGKEKLENNRHHNEYDITMEELSIIINMNQKGE